MALPEILIPSEVPPFNWDHSIEPASPYADVPRQRGHQRKRRVKRTATREVLFGLDLTPAQMASFDTWFESTLLAGQREFSCQVENQGPGLLWWAARLIEYDADVNDDGSWKLHGRLHLRGTGSSVGPTVSSLELSLVTALQGSAALLVTGTMQLSVGAALQQSVNLGLAVSAALNQYTFVLGSADDGTRRTWMRLAPYGGRTADISATVQAAIERSWMGV